MKVQLPKLDLSRLKKESRETGGSGLRPPKFARDLYGDLRDRRLLPLVALLLVAIVATPLLLSSSGEEESVPVAPPIGGAEAPAAAASFQVVPAEPGLRDPRQRLGYRQARDPFKRPATPTPEVDLEAGATESESVEIPAESSGSTFSEPESPSPESSAPVSPGSTATKTEKEIVVEHNVVDYTVDLNAGFADQKEAELGVYKEQATYTQLPNAKKPVVVFMGVTPDHQHALFLMTNEVLAYYGPATCALEQESCQLLELKTGQTETFAYGLEERPYKLTLKKINRVVDAESGSKSKTSTQESKGAAQDKGGSEAQK